MNRTALTARRGLTVRSSRLPEYPGNSKHDDVSRRRLWRVVACLVLAAFFSWAFYTRYWQWRECIHEALSSCVTPDGANLIEGGVVWFVPAALFLVLGVRGLLRLMRRSASQESR